MYRLRCAGLLYALMQYMGHEEGLKRPCRKNLKVFEYSLYAYTTSWARVNISTLAMECESFYMPLWTYAQGLLRCT